jgi:FkbM family methyltransferase
MKTAFDIGANIGQTIDTLYPYYERIVSFEANPNLVDRLKNKYKDNKIIIEGVGVSNKNEIKKFNFSKTDVISTFSEDWMKNSRFTDKYSWEHSILVNTITLDDIINKYGEPDFIKVDVEGYELEVFQGLSMLLENTYFAFEWAEEQYKKINEIIFHVKKIGYKKFSFTYQDKLLHSNEVKWDDWEKLKIHDDIDVNRKDKWGMIYFKK